MKYEDAKTLLMQVAIDQFDGTCPANRIYKAPGVKGVLKKSAVEKALQRMEEEGILEPGAPGKPRRIKSAYWPHRGTESNYVVYIIQENRSGNTNTLIIRYHGVRYLVSGASEYMAERFAAHMGLSAYHIEPHTWDEVLNVASENKLDTIVIYERCPKSWKARLAKFASHQRGVA